MLDIERANITLPRSTRRQVRQRVGERKFSPLVAYLLDAWLAAGAPEQFRVQPFEDEDSNGRLQPHQPPGTEPNQPG